MEVNIWSDKISYDHIFQFMLKDKLQCFELAAVVIGQPG